MPTPLSTSIGRRSLSSRQEEGSALMFFLLPALLVGAVFAFCALAQSPVAELPVDDEAEEAE